MAFTQTTPFSKPLRQIKVLVCDLLCEPGFTKVLSFKA